GNFGSPRKAMPQSINLKPAERQRLVRLARDAGCSPEAIFRDILRDGFEYTEYKVKATNEGLADVAAGRMVSLDELKARIARRRATRGRTRRQAA
ncbi:MAG: hypothetical protein ACT4P9_16250, partial [Betaproteobacteria bacterium]